MADLELWGKSMGLINPILEKGVNIIKRLHKTDYHNQEFVIEDIDGRWIYFGIKEE